MNSFADSNERYVAARQEWDNLYGGVVRSRQHWQKAFFISGVISIILLGIVIYQLLNTHIEVVKVKLFEDGHVTTEVTHSIERIEHSDMNKHIVYMLRHFIERVRSVPISREQLDDNVQRAFDMILNSSPAKATLLNWYQSHDYNILRRRGERTEIEVTVVIPETQKGNIWRIEWIERKIKEGIEQERHIYSAVAKVVIVPPTDIDTIYRNALGVYVYEINWSRKR